MKKLPYDLDQMVQQLHLLNLDYAAVNQERARLSNVKSRPAQWDALAKRADRICGGILHTERRIISHLLENYVAR